VKTCESDAVQRRSCRLGPHWVTVDSRDGKVKSVELGTRGSRDDRSLGKDIEGVLSGGRIPAHLHVDASGLPEFTRKVLGRCAGIRPGQVMTYSGLAKAVGRPRAARAVGQVMAGNPFALLIPCHRVVGSDYSLHGFGGGLEMKEWLLAREGWETEGRGRGRRLAAKRSQKPEARSQSAEVPDRSRRRRGGAGK
jgi:methylated-DNA-[protein]-cysteine S-methyltransferase